MRFQRLGRAVQPALLIAVAGVATRPFGPLAGTMLLVLTLPPLAASLDRLGWAGIVADRLRRARLSTTAELLTAYLVWLAVSAILTLDVAAVIAVPVGLRLAGEEDEQSGRNHLGAAILGSNIGSLLFPFSNLTNLIVVSATGISFGAYLAAAWLPQLAAAFGVGFLLLFRTRPGSDRAALSQVPRATIHTTVPVGEATARIPGFTLLAERSPWPGRSWPSSSGWPAGTLPLSSR